MIPRRKRRRSEGGTNGGWRRRREGGERSLHSMAFKFENFLGREIVLLCTYSIQCECFHSRLFDGKATFLLVNFDPLPRGKNGWMEEQ